MYSLSVLITIDYLCRPPINGLTTKRDNSKNPFQKRRANWNIKGRAILFMDQDKGYP